MLGRARYRGVIVLFMVPAQAVDPVLARSKAFLGEFVGDETVAQGDDLCGQVQRSRLFNSGGRVLQAGVYLNPGFQYLYWISRSASAGWEVSRWRTGLCGN